MKKEKNRLIIGKFFIVLGFVLVFGYLVFNLSINLNEQKKIKKVIDNIDIDSYVFNEETNKKNDDLNYIAVLEIPKINLKKGLYGYNSIYNNVDKNIEILNDSKMPNKENSMLILASHSGNSSVSYFNNLSKLQKNDLVIFYYDGVKYFYKIIDFYTKNKSGFIDKPKFKSGKYIILTTCKDSLNQLVYIGKLVKEV
ncbi:MAG: sortase [Bacilli bacterium]